MHVCIGGSFNPLHKGHKMLIRKALDVAGERGYLFIGLTSDEMIVHKQKNQNYKEREESLQNYLDLLSKNTTIEIGKIDDLYGRALERVFDAIVVSSETFSNAEKINTKRRSMGLADLQIYTIELVKGADGKPISSTKIRNRSLTADGRLFK